MANKALDEVLSNFQDRIIGVKSIDSRNAVFEPVPARCHFEYILDKFIMTLDFSRNVTSMVSQISSPL